jgi:transcriptional regulator with XRE-family HTH domain
MTDLVPAPRWAPLPSLVSGPPADRSFPELLRHHRIRTGLTQRALADLSTVSPRAIRDLEAGRANARTQTIHLLADALRLQGAGRELFVRASLNRRPTNTFDVEGGRAPNAVNALRGRKDEVRAMAGSLRSGDRRMISLCGLPGVGKSRVAAEVAARLRAEPRWPVLWLGAAVPALQGQGTAFGPLMRSLRSLIEADPAAGIDQIRQLVDRQHALLVLDGIAGDRIAAGVAELLAYCPGLRVLSTSRTPWHMPGVRASVLSPLAVPAPEWPAGCVPDDLTGVPSVQLLADRLAEVRPGFVLDAANAAAAAEMCRRLDGLPLALEAVAGRSRVLSLAHLLDVPASALLDLAVPTRPADPASTLGELIGAGLGRLDTGPRTVLHTLARGDRRWTAPEAAATLRRPLEDVVDDLDELIGYGMLQALHDGPATELRVPRLLRSALLRDDRTERRS